ncbi:MAG TPA: nitrate- and nitrite sensing domain-containing protein [Pilimelia sp.]|nr:nitrate- and nitrite sensing domain-containing protein [Pilimelia sp.]
MTAANGISRHKPAGRLRSVRVRLLLLVLPPMVGLVGLAGVHAHASLAAMSDAARGVVMADAATATASLVHQLERERAETAALRDRGGSAGEALVLVQRARTDAAAARYDRALRAALLSARPLTGQYQSAGRQLARLAGARAAALPSPPGTATTGWDLPYREIAAAVVEVGRALSQQLTDHRLAAQARAIAEVTAATYALAQQRDLLRSALTRSRYSPADRASLAALAAVERERRQAFLAAADPAARAAWQNLVRGIDVAAMTRTRDAALAGDPRVLSFDADAWHVAATHAIRLLHEVELALAQRLHETATGRRTDARRAAAAVLGGSAAIALATLAVAVALVTRISRRLRRLRDAALAVAGEELPAAIQALSRTSDPAGTHAAQLATARQIDAAIASGPADEIAQVGRSFAAVHRQALQLATEQALLRLDTAALFVALARRNQTLVQRQLRAIDDVERDETDPDRLSSFYTVDHLAARMRRNNENLLVLGGSAPGRQFTTAQLLFDVVRAAASEIADYARVDPMDLPPVAVVGQAVGDVVHLLAELLENATKFSGPDTQVRVTARETAESTLLSIYDDGIGMAAGDLADANHRLATRADLTASLAGTMGLLVVARLAARHGVDVHLRSHPGTGTVALVRLPDALVVTSRTGGPDGSRG